MNNTPRSIQWLVWGGLAAIIAAIAVAFIISKTKTPAPPAPLPPVIAQVANFTLTNQDGHVTTLADLTNHVWVADIIFTRCAGPCPRMTGQMRELQTALPSTVGAKLVTLTTDPDFDTPPVLKKYAARFGADAARWTFLTGTKAQIAALASDSLKLSALPVKPEDRKDDADLFIHSTIFVVVDKHAQLRAVIETGGEGVDWNDSRQKILALIAQLEAEP